MSNKSNNKMIIGVLAVLMLLAGSVLYYGTHNKYYIWEDKGDGNWDKTDIFCPLKGTPEYMCHIHCISDVDIELWDACSKPDPERNMAMAYGVFEKQNSEEYNRLCFYPQSCYPITYNGICEVVCPLG